VGQCVLLHDVACKSMLRRYGGGGYSYLLTDLRPSTLMRGPTEEALEQMLIRNPARWLAGDDSGSL
jgi:phosphotriesterase-related protein